MIKIGLVHTTINSIAPINEAFAKLDKNVRLFNFLDEGVMLDLRTKGATSMVRENILHMIWRAEECGAQGIMLNCSLMSPHVNELQQQVGVPLISADIAMLDYVADRAEKVTVIATVPKAGPTTQKLLEDIAQARGKKISVAVRIAEGAFEALNVGDVDKHNEIIQRVAKEVDGTCDIIAFAQISMARVLTANFSTQSEIATSPIISAKTLLSRIEG